MFTETSHWITAGHFLIDVFQGMTLNGSRDDFRRFVILDTEAAIKEQSVLTARIDNLKKELSVRDTELARLRSENTLSPDAAVLRSELAEAKAVAARLSGMYEQKSKDFRDSELKRLALLGKQIIADGEVQKPTPATRPRPAS
ncbi:hypothetical protein AX14_000291 [Amanita brunnescens Koide BX004]|nr:hypothetical protein AX14_000291 [Amanita brunnescens Koide BX004]